MCPDQSNISIFHFPTRWILRWISSPTVRAWEIESHVSVPDFSPPLGGRECEFQFTLDGDDLVLIKMLVNLDAKGSFKTRRDFQFTWDAKDFQFTWDVKWIFIYLGREMVFQFTWDSKWIFNLGTRMESHYQGRERIFNLPGTRKDFQFTWDANEF